jgi:release factor glutamine methyltransferase
MIYQPAEDSYLFSEILKKQLPILLKKNPNLTFLEIGAGSGIQLQTALDSGVKKQNIFACDINSQAVKHCKNLGFNCIKSNLFENIKGKYDMIIFNPPYLPEDKLEPKDSKVSTTGGKQGSEILNKFLNRAKNYLTKQGKVFILISSLTKFINFKDAKTKILGTKKLFFEELYVLQLEYGSSKKKNNN